MSAPDLDHLLGLTSRTFAIGIRRLPPLLRHEVTVAYLVLRVSDYLEDTVRLDQDEKARALGAWAEAIGSERSPDLSIHLPEEPDLPDRAAAVEHRAIWKALGELGADAREVIATHTAESTRGMRRWVLRGPLFRTEADLDDYMHEVAGRVGYLLTDLFAVHSAPIEVRRAELLPLAREFGLGLQTVNVIRGLHEDPRRGWNFVPASFGSLSFEREGGWRGGSEETGAVLDRLVEKARRHLDAALEYISLLPRRERGIRIFCEVPYFLAERTTTLSAGSPEVFTREVKVPRTEVRRIAALTSLLGQSNLWLRRYGRRLRTGV